MTIYKKGVYLMSKKFNPTPNQLCIIHSTCSGCPLWVDCKRRKLFYSENSYHEHRKELAEKIRTEAEKLALSKEDINLGVNFIIHAVDEHRVAELLENPVYSA